MTHDVVLNELGCDDLDDLVEVQFLREFALDKPGQYGVVADDVPDAIARLRRQGASEFAYAKLTVPNWMEYGVAKNNVAVELAFGYSNHQQIELLGAGKNTSLYSDYISSDECLRLHHVCVFQKGIVELERRLNAAGYETVIAGDLGMKNIFTTRFRYLDTRATLGFYLELCEHLLFTRHAPPPEALIRFFARRQGRFSGALA